MFTLPCLQKYVCGYYKYNYDSHMNVFWDIDTFVCARIFYDTLDDMQHHIRKI